MKKPSTKKIPKFEPRFLGPQFWGIWSMLAFMRSLVMLPHPVRMAIGRLFGRTLRMFAAKRRRIAERNLRLCFPKADKAWIDHTVNKNFDSMGEAILETAMCWWSSEKTLMSLTEIDGLENLEQALQDGKGAILLSAHFTSLELGVRLLDPYTEATIYPVYQIHKNPLMEYVITRSRLLHAEAVIPHRDVRSMVRALKSNGVLWYAPDQNWQGKFKAMVDFFGVPAPSNTATAKLAQLSGAKVLPYIVQRKPNNQGYRVHIGKAFENFPSDDPIADTRRYHQMIEQEVQSAPEQYLWAHKRFKSRGKDYEDVYADL